MFELKQLAECRSRAANKLVVLAECKPMPAEKCDSLAECQSRVADESVFADESRADCMMELTNRSRATGLLMGQEPLARLELLSASQGLLATYFGNCQLQQLAAPLKILALFFIVA